MTTRRFIFMTVFVGAVLLVSALAGRAQAEIVPVPVPFVPPDCYFAAHDMNKDRKVDEADFNLWKDLMFKSGGNCANGASADACPAGMDINGDGYVTFDDLNIMLDRFRVCMRGPDPVLAPR